MNEIGMKSKKPLWTGRGHFFRLLVWCFCLLFLDGDIHAQICLTQDTNPSAPVRQLYVVAGQSNAVGLASVKDIVRGADNYAKETTVYPHVQIYGIQGAPLGVRGNDDAVRSRKVSWSEFAKWGVASPGYGYKNPGDNARLFPFGAKPMDFFGPELYLAHFLNSQPPYDHYIVKLAVSNTSLNYTPSADSWTPTGHLYTELLRMIASAYNSKRATVRLRVAGVFFMQGETDALNEMWAKSYKNNLSHFVLSLRRDLNEMGCSEGSDFPVVIGKIQDNPAWLYRQYVRAAQQEVSRNLPRMANVNTDDFAGYLVAGGVHFNEYGQFHLGERAYQALAGAAFAGSSDSLFRRRRIARHLRPISAAGTLWRAYCCSASSLTNRALQKYLPWTYRYDGVCQSYTCTMGY